MKFKNSLTTWKLIIALQFVGSVCVFVGSYANWILNGIGQFVLLPGSIVAALLANKLIGKWEMIGKWEIETAIRMHLYPVGLMDRIYLPFAVLFNLVLFSLCFRIVRRAKNSQPQNNQHNNEVPASEA